LGLLIAIVLYPSCKWLEGKGIPKSIAIGMCLLLVGLLLAALIGLLVWELGAFREDAPEVMMKLKGIWLQVQAWARQRFGEDVLAHFNWLQKLADNLGSIFQSTITATANMLFVFFLVPVYSALFLYHRKAFVRALIMAVPEEHHEGLHTILNQTIHTYHRYIKGMVWVYLIVGVLNALGLWALGVEHAFMFGMLCAIMTIIPYAGIIVSALLPISVVWLSTGSIWYPIGVIAIFGVVQYLEANVIFPRVVGEQLNVSTWATLVAIIAGGVVWGVSGMILFVPFVAILKIVSDHVGGWKSLNILLSREWMK
jgi:predicted PurR-regulated permease PerM